MKKLRILIPVGLFLVAGLIFVACQKDAPLRGEKKVMAVCEIPCIDLTADPIVYFPQTNGLV
jgi:hypothetical protein